VDESRPLKTDASVFCLSSASLGVVTGAPVPVLDGVVLVPEPW
jgi:hypothetical protein